MKRKAQDITDTELSVLQILWDREAQSAREITEALYPECRESDVGTVHSMLQRLEQKEFVTRNRGVRPHLFSALVDRDEVAGRELKALAERVTGGALAPFLSHLVEAEELGDDDLAELRKLIDQRTRKQKRSGRKG